MEAIVVAPAPPQAPQAKNVQSEKSGDDSTFAPTLAQALSDKKSSGNKQSAADGRQAAPPEEGQLNADTSIKEDAATAEEQSTAAAGLAALTNEQQLTAASGRGRHSAAQPQTAAGDGGERGLVGSRSPLFSLPAQAAFVSSADSAAIATALKNGTPTEPIAFSFDISRTVKAGDQALRQQSANFSSPAAMTDSLQAGTPQSPVMTFQNGRHPLAMMQHDDSISWSRIAPDKQQNFFQKPLSIAFAEDGIMTPQAQTQVSTEKLLAGLSQITADGKNPVSLRNGDQISLRHAINGQFIEARTETADSGGEQKGAQQFLDGESNPARQMLSSATAKPADGSVESSFSQSLSQAGGDKISQPAADPMRPGALPFSATAVTDNEILQQVVNKFRISQHMQDSRISMKLHPAELGNLKIDIQLKGGSINANIVAQTQQVQEILEKNMPRLKALMEQQGLKVEDIIIKLDPDVPSEHNLFDEQLSQQGSFAEDGSAKPRSVFSMETALEEEDVAEHTMDPGVNVTI